MQQTFVEKKDRVKKKRKKKKKEKKRKETKQKKGLKIEYTTVESRLILP